MKEVETRTHKMLNGGEVTVTSGQESSVTIKQNAKGEPQIEVKIYHADAHVAQDEAVDIYFSTLRKLSEMIDG